MITRRFFAFSALAGLSALLPCSRRTLLAAQKPFPVAYTDEEWRERLTPQQYAILRQYGTERPHSSPLNDEHRRGSFVCAGCGAELFSSSAKYESSTGWPSFWMPVDKIAVGESIDTSYGMIRTEIHCARCGGHLGHVFPDGPLPTGLRYCVNGDSMLFHPLE